MVRRVYKLTKSGHCARGTNMVQQSIVSVLEDCTKMNSNSGKFDNGNIYFYDSTKSGIKDENDTYYEYYNTGWMCVDFDIELSTIKKYNKEHNTNYNHNDLVQLIWDKFKDYSSYVPCINYIQYSSSHYLKPDVKDGVHILVRCRKGLVHQSFYGKSFNGCDKIFNQFDLFEYQHECLRFVINRLISEHCGIPLDLLGLVNDDAMDRFGQKMTLFYSPYQSNQFSIDTIVFDAENRKDWQVKFKKTAPDKLDKDSIVVKDVTHLDVNNIKYDGDKIQVDHYNRWVKIKSLLTYGFSEDETLNICNQYYTNNIESGDKPYTLQDWYNYYNLHVKKNSSTLSKSAFNKTIRELRNKGLDLEVSFYDKDVDYVLQPNTSNLNNVITIDGYLSEVPGFRRMVLDELKKGDKVYIKVNTGAGKTQSIHKLFKDLNPIVITPYNTTNKLYEGFLEISSSTNNSYTPNKPMVCIYDQFMKPEFLREVVKDNRLVIIDECHTMSDERSFRENVVLCDEFIRDYNNVIAVSATPGSELERHRFNLLEFYKESPVKNIFITKTDNVLQSMTEKIDQLRYEGKKIVVFTDRYMKRLYEHYSQQPDLAGEVLEIRADRKNSKGYKDLLDTELIKHKLTFCTRIFFNGGNIKNTNEDITFVTEINEDTTSIQLNQITGRLRNNKGDVYVFVDTNKDLKEEKGVEERNGLTKADLKKERTLLTNELLQKTNSDAERDFIFDGSGLRYDEKDFDDRYLGILREIEEWNREHSKIDVIIEDLCKVKHFRVWVGETTHKEKKALNSVKRNISNKLKKDLEDENKYVDGVFYGFVEIEGNRDSYNYIGENKYLYEWMKKIQRICNKGVGFEVVKDYISNSDERNLIDTILDKLYLVVCVGLLKDDDFNNLMGNLERLKEGQRCNKIHYVELEKKIKDYNKYRECAEKILGGLDTSDINFDDWEGLCEFEERLLGNNQLRKYFFKDFDLGSELVCCKLMEDGSFFDLCLVEGIVGKEVEEQRKRYLEGKKNRNESHSKKVRLVYKNGVVKEFDSDGEFRKWWSDKFGGGDNPSRVDFKKLKEGEIVNGWTLHSPTGEII